jgi:outer membrane protein insertion porin family
LLLIAGGILFSQASRFIIRSIVVVGNERTEASTIRLNSGLFIGKEITSNDIQLAIKNLWELRQWKKVDIDAGNLEGNEVDIYIRVVEYPRLKTITVEGSEEYDEDDIKNLLRFYPGMVITPFKLFKAKNKLFKEYEKEGYLLATVDIDTTNAKDNRVNLKITVDEGPEVQVERIRVIGAKELDPDDIIDAMEETDENGFLGFGGDFEREKYETDKELLVKFMQDEGFRNASLIRDSIYYSKDREEMFIDLHVYEGKRYFFGNISILGNEKITQDEIFENINLVKGQPYSETKFIEAKQQLTQLYYNIGHLFSQISPQESLTEPDTINIVFNIDERNVVRVNEVIITGNTKTNDKVVRREIKLLPGQKFSSEKIQRSMSDLMLLNYFENVVPDVKTKLNNAETVDILFDVKEKSTDQANASIGYSELDGLIGSVGLTFNNFSLSRPFQQGDGQQLALNAQFGGVQTVYSVSVTEPWFLNTPTLIGMSVYYSQTRRDNARFFSYVPYDEDSKSISLTVGRRLKWPDNFFKAAVTFRYSDSEVSNVDDFLKEQSVYYRLIDGRKLVATTVSTSVTRDSRNSAEFPTQGSLYNVVNEFNFGDRHFYQGLANVQNFIPLGRSGLIFHTNVKTGANYRLSDDTFLSVNDLFYMGGSGLAYNTESLRGYGDRSVGAANVVYPSTRNSEVGFSSEGGDAMFKFTSEIRFQILPNPTIFGLAFFEAGNVWKHPGDIDISNLRRSAGVGVRLFMPLVGIIGLDVGYGFDRYDQFSRPVRTPTWEFHFQFGKF